ncbi:MAG: FimB/Mfa2 family fimbrial subunit [Muribaculaceae bacterium]|nr:FimB/Mfa2 family fimbrial subunit [Muribaculaceae bacterium]
MRLTISNIIAITILLLTGMAATSCSMVEEDRSDCPTGLFIRFVYDYNTQRADMFKDHVGHVQVYIFDEKGRLMAMRSVSNNELDSPLARYGYTMYFTPEELPTGRNYRIQAVAMQRDWTDALTTVGAKYRHSASPTENSESMIISLDHNNTPIEGTKEYAVSNAAPLDTLWHTLKVIAHDPTDTGIVPDMDRTAKPYSIYPIENQMVHLEKEHATYATVSLIRDTKHLNLTIRNADDEEAPNMYASDYEVKIVDNNAHLSHDNTVLTTDSVRYTPYASWTSRLLDNQKVEIETIHSGNPGQYHAPGTRDLQEAGEPKVLQRTAHYNLMFNRLMLDDQNLKNNAYLEIHRQGKLVARVNLPYILSQGRMAYDIYNYGSQEYLDREYNYDLHFFLRGGVWAAVEIQVLSWSIRFQPEEL